MAVFSIIKTQSFTPLNHIFIANKVNEEKCEVIEFNNRPVAEEYADAVDAASILSKVLLDKVKGDITISLEDD